ncbi:MAG: hypothetical protein NTX15_03330 [Candidatus Kapabacteria bacterium]|nr:hypothetical protein [Candidatus Kapabacteria bacterium]
MSSNKPSSSVQDELRTLLNEEFSQQESRALASSFRHTADRLANEADSATRNMSVFVNEARQQTPRLRRGVYVGFVATALTAATALVIVLHEEPLPKSALSSVTTLKTDLTMDRVDRLSFVAAKKPRPHIRSVSTTDVADILTDAEEDQVIQTITQSVGYGSTWTVQDSDIDDLLGGKNDGL